jgi:hypothetical protein
MKRTGIVLLTATLFGAAFLFPAVRQVRVTAQRAGIYAEPDRKSTRVDIVRQGALLSLFQQQKVKEIWYYVSYVSPQYGSRVSGFILESAVEPVQDGAPAGEQPAVPAPQPEKPPVTVSTPSPAVPQKPASAAAQKKPEIVAPAKADIPAETPKVVEVTVVALTARLPRAQRISLPRRAATPVDIPWAILEPPAPEPVKPPAIIATPAPAAAPKAAAVERPPAPRDAEIMPAARPELTGDKPKVVEVSMVTGMTPAPRAKRVSLPRRAAVLQDLPWAIIQPPPPQPQQAPAIAPRPAPPAAPKAGTAEAGMKTEPASKVQASPAAEKEAPRATESAKPKSPGPRPADSPAPAAPQARPPQLARRPDAGRRPSRFGLSLGFGPSFGGTGGALQVNLSRGLALHAGYGVYPTTVVYSETDWVKNESLWSAGLRIYPMPSSEKVVPYIDAQYGGFIVEAAQVITGIYDYSFVYESEQKALWGPTLLAGLEIRFGRFALSGGIGASYSLTDWDVLESRVFFAFEAGLGVRF